jgi:hypothetical protein
VHNTRLNEHKILERGISHQKRFGDGSGIELDIERSSTLIRERLGAYYDEVEDLSITVLPWHVGMGIS